MSSVGHRQQQPQQQLVTLFVCILFLGTLLWSAECISAFRPSYSHSSTSFQRMDKRSILLKMMASISNGVPSSSSSVPVSPSPPLKIAVIGAGAAGLAAARVISRSSSRTERAAPPSVTVLEKDFQVGGIWCYSPSSSSSSVAAPSGNHVKSSNIKNNVNSDGTKMRPMYRGLRTNLPKEVMQYREFPWILMEPKDCNNNGSSSSDEIASTTTSAQVPPPSFVTHSQVADYLADYQARFGLDKYIQYGASVRQLTVLTKDDDDDGDNDDSEQGTTKSSVVSTPSSSERWPKIRLDWEVRTNHQLTQQQQRHSTTDRQYSEVFDAVMVCNGHYSQPSSPSIDGLEQYFAGNTMHSISYDDPKDFAGQTVLCIGGRASGSDLARELSFHAKEVYLSDTTCSEATTVVDDENDNQVTWVPKTLSMREDGSIQFDKNCPLHPVPDTIIFCSGYDYSFPFINDESNIELRVAPGERRVAPLYKQLVRQETEKIFQLPLFRFCRATVVLTICFLYGVLFFTLYSGTPSCPTWHSLVCPIPSYPFR